MMSLWKIIFFNKEVFLFTLIRSSVKQST